MATMAVSFAACLGRSDSLIARFSVGDNGCASKHTNGSGGCFLWSWDLLVADGYPVGILGYGQVEVQVGMTIPLGNDDWWFSPGTIPSPSRHGW